MQKRVRKNSEYIWAKKPKLDLPPNNDQEKTDTTAAPSQFAHTKEIDKKSEQFVRNISSTDCNDFSDVNIVEKPSSSSSSLNSVMKTFSKSDSDSIELKEVFKQIMNDGENDDHLLCSDTASDSSNKNITNLLIHENSEAAQDSSLITKSENESLESLSSFKLLHRENDILIDFNTNTRMSDTTNNHNVPDGNSICIPTENELFLTDSSNSKDQPMSTKKQMESLVMNTKVVEDPNVPKSNAPPTLLNCNLNVSNVAPLEMNAANEKKKLLPDQTTAKVSIGDTTISVPLLKPLNFRRIITNEGKSVPNIVRKVINIRGKKIKAPTILQFSQVQLNPKTNAKIVQATLVGNKIQLPNNIGLKTSQGFIKSNLVQTSQCSGMSVTSLPKQIFDDEMVFVEKTPSNPQSQSQNQSQTVEDYDAKAIETLPANNAINKSTVKPKEMNNKTIATEDQVQKSNSSYLTQLCVIETDANALPKSFENTITDMTQSSISVASSCESTLSKVTATVSKLSRKPIMVTKTVSASELVSGTMNSTIDALSNQPKDNQQKMLENNPLLRKQIALTVQNCNRFQLKTSKSTDDMKLKAKERIGEAIGIGPPKRQMTKIGSIVVQNPTTEASSMITSVDKEKQSNQAKSEEPQNVLLKHLLQSSSNQRSNTTCNTTLAPRKLAPVRAPSLGVVSSLEAQLARPVMPPVSSVGEMKPELKLQTKLMNDKLKKNLNDRENINMTKSRPEMISRETSFVSTFSPRNKPPQTTSTPPEYERMTSMPSSTSHTIEIDGPKTAPVQTNSMTNSNNHAINLFKFFKQQEQEKSPTIEPNTNHMHNQVSSPDIGPDNKLTMVTKSEYDNLNLDVASSSAMKSKLTKMEIDQNIEMRKRLKRDYQKQKRQVLLNKEPQNHQKKKSRKLSKASEDFDEFIENKVVQMKQMFVLEVLEPLLSTFLGICSIYGHNERIRNHVEYSQHHGSKDEFGRTNLKNLVDFYSMKPYGPHPNNKVSNKPSFQNKFYDEEFSTINHESCDKLYHFIHNLKQQSLQPADNTALITHSPCKATRNQTNNSYPYRSFPGIKFQRSYNLNADRMSPVIPLIHPNSFGSMKRKKPIHTSRHKHTLAAMDTTVILTLSSFVAENLLDILRDLEKLLNTYSPVSHKLLNNDKVNVSNIKGVYISRIRNLQRTETTNIQNFLNGTYKCCRNCHLTIICGIVGADSNLNIKKKILADSHFCDKFCCIQYKKKGRKFIVSRKKERCYPNNVSANNKITTNESNCCNTNNSNYKVVSPNCFWRPTHKTLANDDVNENILKMRIAITLSNGKDTRRCILCNQKGDAFADGSSRLLNYDVNKWVHLNCALWSNSVYETINGGLMNLELTMQQGLHQICSFCNQYGATIKCFKIRCGHIYHLPCAIKEQCVFYKNKTIHCASHAHRMEKKNELNSIRVRRRVYIERDENRQVAAVMHHLELSNLLRIGNLTFINVGQLLPHQLEAFHTPNYIYPIGYKIIRFFWSMKKLNKRCRYICSIVETNGRPEFVIQVQESFEGDVELRDISPKAVWQRVLDKIAQLRRGQPLVQLFTEFFTGEDLFGLSEPSIVRILESLPGVESLTDYRFKYGRNPLLELPLALNPSGSARTEPKQRHIINWKKAHTQRTSSINLKLSLSPSSLVAGEVACPYSKQFVHSKSSQYRKMKQEWRNNVYLARSKIQGLGLYAARDLEKHTMVIEYIGQVIRTEVSELREKQYDLRNRGIYMFRLDEERVVDATLSGGLARYINHSCNPNCVTEIVDVDREYRIIIFAKRRINKGEELSYDYKFDIEDDAHKISCMCDAPNCRKWMN